MLRQPRVDNQLLSKGTQIRNSSPQNCLVTAQSHTEKQQLTTKKEKCTALNIKTEKPHFIKVEVEAPNWQILTNAKRQFDCPCNASDDDEREEIGYNK